MSILSSYVRFHWRIFNIMARLFGLMAMLFAINAIAAAAYYTLYPAPVTVNGVAMPGLPASGVSLIVGAFTAAIGVAVLRVRTYRPDLGDSTWSSRRSPPHAEQHRNWWTGDPKPGQRRQAP